MKILVNVIELNYDVYGEGKSVILLNPNSVHTKLFMKPIVNLFKQDFKVYCVDRRCCGKSTKDCELTYEESAKDIYDLIFYVQKTVQDRFGVLLKPEVRFINWES